MSPEDSSKEECLYCHTGLVDPDKPCPFCGDIVSARDQAAEPGVIPQPKVVLEFRPEHLQV